MGRARVFSWRGFHRTRLHSTSRRCSRSYEHTNAICNVLNGVPAPKLPLALEERLKAMFADIQEPFERNCPPQRKNFLSYGYTLYKFCELLGEVSLSGDLSHGLRRFEA